MAQRGSLQTLTVVAWFACAGLPAACGSADPAVEVSAATGPLRINEVMTDNDSAWLDDADEVDDWIELANVTQQTIALARFGLRDDRGRSFPLPAIELAGGGVLVLSADSDPEQGPTHMPWKLSAQGVALELVELATGESIDRVEVPALAQNEAFARFGAVVGAAPSFERCRYASPGRANGESCAPPEPPMLSDRSWPAYALPEGWPATPGPLAISELALKPARFVEVRNLSAQSLPLSDFQLRASRTSPGQPWPDVEQGAALSWPVQTLGPNAALRVPVDAAQLAALAADSAFEGVVTLFDASGTAVERVDFMHWPDGASLSRPDPARQRFMFCTRTGPSADSCEPLPSRSVGERLRHLYTPADYAALAEGDTSAAMRGVKFVVDLAAGESVHLLSARAYALHYTFIREQIEAEPALDRCDPEQSQQFMQGWIDFSQREYFRSEGRRYLLGTLASYAGSDARAVDFAVGDQITGAQMRHAFYAAISHADAQAPSDWAIHPTEPRQETELESVQGSVPIMGANAPFRGLQWQPLTSGVAWGKLMFVAESELSQAALGPDTIVVTDAVPNDIPFVAGLITEAFQSPLAHVNVLSQNRGTPNLALRSARAHEQVAQLMGQLVRFEVGAAGFQLRAATAEEVAAAVQSHKPSGTPVRPRIDLSVRGPVDLSGRGLEDLPSLGAKAAQLAELARVQISQGECAGAVPLPATPFALPIVHYAEHFERSGARAMLEAELGSAQFEADSAYRTSVLAGVRHAIEQTPVDPQLLTAVTAMISERFGDARLRFRSSSNTEDLPEFNGAGLYESWSGALGDPERPIEDAIRKVWSSLWSPRAFDERSYGNIDQSQVGMGVLVHPAFRSERANVIIISRDLLDPTHTGTHYMNAQLGEASVANPAPGVTSEELLHHLSFVPGTPELEYRSQSSLSRGQPVLQLQDARRLSCVVRAIHDHFRRELDPDGTDRWFAMDVEAKLMGDDRHVVIKQARPFNFGRVERPNDCREY